jgi:hypothetical protein
MEMDDPNARGDNGYRALHKQLKIFGSQDSMRLKVVRAQADRPMGGATNLGRTRANKMP